jgi:pyridoxal phosphate-dependent aminotransferase EpsN
MNDRIYLSPPHMGPDEQALVAEAFRDNWIAPLGPHVDGFEREFETAIGGTHAVALSSGTAALHLALIIAGVGPGDAVLVSSLTFAASVNPIVYLGATPHLIDSEADSWNMDPALLEAALEDLHRKGKKPKAVIAVHLYGQMADILQIQQICDRYEVLLIEDAAEALGSTCEGRSAGTFAPFSIFSFNGNKMITTSGGGMLVARDPDHAAHARKLATQARDQAPHYEHSEIGYNYRLSNVLAAIGRGQLRVLPERVAARRRNFQRYEQLLGDLPGLRFMAEAPWCTHSRWLTTLTIDPQHFGASREDVRLALESQNIESRPVWKPMHLQPVYRDAPVTGGAVSAALFEYGLCLPSGSSLSEHELERVAEIVSTVHTHRHRVMV